MKVASADRLSGTVELPGDKSISHRAAMIAAIAEGRTEITNFSPSADCRSTLNCLSALGVDIEVNGPDITIGGRGGLGLRAPHGPLDCGNSGTTIRLLAGMLAGQDFECTLTGDRSLSRRPMRRIIDPLEKMGAVIGADDERPPLTIRGRQPLGAISYTLPIASAQVKSSVLLAGLFAESKTTIVEPAVTRDHTERMLRWFGASVSVDGLAVSIDPAERLIAHDLTAPGDISAAAFFMIAAACIDGSDVRFLNIGVNPTRAAVIGVLRDAGVKIDVNGQRALCNEPVGDVRVRAGLRHSGIPLRIAGNRTAALIDELPVLAVLGTQLHGGIEVRGAEELRLKETDRIAAIGENLGRMGAKVTIFDDGFRVEPSPLRGSTVDAFGDHRIAMAMAVAGLIAEGETEIHGAECVDVSFPDFFDVLSSVVS